MLASKEFFTKTYTNGLLLKPELMNGLIAVGLGELQFFPAGTQGLLV